MVPHTKLTIQIGLLTLLLGGITLFVFTLLDDSSLGPVVPTHVLQKQTPCVKAKLTSILESDTEAVLNPANLRNAQERCPVQSARSALREAQLKALRMEPAE